ncbi:hypothetical protein O7626_19450 [Micromonospora sp. WMMD1102]|uniref:hypothetical protein n=1 Tax=Micromonospora sp. WMMD1102 TaxID=3016105 RepID=UPI002415819A|nr:hypothetical protein [Micromonospora sp. WMMD1102]MDG4788090.1 hypothetical protein [Micromonospora sp. WMMD1102]
MGLRLGELSVILRTDNDQLRKGMADGRQEVRRGGRDMETEAAATAVAMAAVLGAGGQRAGEEWVRGADGRLRDARGRFVSPFDGISKSAGPAGAMAALGFLGRFGADFGAKISNIVSGGFSGLPPQVQGVLAAVGATMAATMAAAFGAALAAGVLLAVGGGVLAVGIKQAIKDPRVAAAWSTFGDRAKEALTGFAEPFKGPLIRAADTFGDAIERWGPGLKEIGAMIAPVIDKLAPALTKFGDNMMPGLKEAVEQSVPLFETLAEYLPEIGVAMSSFLSSIASGGEGANTVLTHMLMFIEGAIIAAGWLIGSLASLYQWIVDTFSSLGNTTATVWNSIKNGATSAGRWVVDKFTAMVDFIRGLPSRISRAASGMWNGIRESFRSALNWIIGRWNSLELQLPSVSFMGATVGGGSVGTPNIPFLARGGTATAAGLAIVGEEGPELVHLGRGATVQPLSNAGGGFLGTLRLILEWPDGRVIKDQLIDAAALRSQTVDRYLGLERP